MCYETTVLIVVVILDCALRQWWFRSVTPLDILLKHNKAPQLTQSWLYSHMSEIMLTWCKYTFQNRN